MRDALPKIHDAGAELIVIGNGAPEMARDFVREIGLTSPLYTDPTLRSYQAAGFRRSVASVVAPRAALNYFRTRAAGFRMTGIRGNPLQQGGIIVVDRSGRVRYAYANRESSDHAPLAEVFGALPARGDH